jgi:DNA-binding CsgD family transcriptional regulator
MAHALAVLTAGAPATRAWIWPVDHRGLMLDEPVVLTRGAQPQAPSCAARAYREQYWIDDPFAPHRFLDTRRAVVTIDDVGGPAAVASTAYGREFLAASGFAHRVLVQVRDAGRLVSVATLVRTPSEPPFADGEIAFLHRVLPLIQLAYSSSLIPAQPLRHEHLLTEQRLRPREIEVARLAACGRTNVEIGQALMISPETVKRHLSSVYRKLDLRSRVELSVYLGRE